jgi:hypothetical protein
MDENGGRLGTATEPTKVGATARGKFTLDMNNHGKNFRRAVCFRLNICILIRRNSSDAD